MPVIGYEARFIGWMTKTRKLLRARHSKTDVDKLYLRKAEGGRGLVGVEDYLRIEVTSLGKYLQICK